MPTDNFERTIRYDIADQLRTAINLDSISGIPLLFITPEQIISDPHEMGVISVFLRMGSVDGLIFAERTGSGKIGAYTFCPTTETVQQPAVGQIPDINQGIGSITHVNIIPGGIGIEIECRKTGMFRCRYTGG